MVEDVIILQRSVPVVIEIDTDLRVQKIQTPDLNICIPAITTL